eukprot:TRINITY_DN28953_c0_g2_i1.p2 TRINITY_DN28953_c0_g2~~TRINITY_DN28953_c0_g2_i1.p2  ORF type:complete len:165 (-),score=46.89 TRINITY_DN28953_c0_g2_i1:60-554(-)
MASTAADSTPRNRAALWVKPTRIAAAGAAAMAISAALLLIDANVGGPREPAGLLKKDAAPVVAPAPAREPLMRREEPLPKAAAPERPKEWGGLMRREPKAVVPPAAAGDEAVTAAKGFSGFRAVALAVVGVLVLMGFAQQARNIFGLLLESPEVRAFFGNCKDK